MTVRASLVRAVMVAACSVSVCAAGNWKLVAHLSSLPLVEGGGIYSSVVALRDSDNGTTQAAAITNLSVLAVNAGLGAFTMFAHPTRSEAFTKVHRMVGYLVGGAAVFLSVAATNDRNVNETNRAVTYAYTLTTYVPLILFEF
jgi:hypothetical protein